VGVGIVGEVTLLLGVVLLLVEEDGVTVVDGFGSGTVGFPAGLVDDVAVVDVLVVGGCGFGFGN
jgi:hypothetical protein